MLRSEQRAGGDFYPTVAAPTREQNYQNLFSSLVISNLNVGFAYKSLVDRTTHLLSNGMSRNVGRRVKSMSLFTLYC